MNGTEAYWIYITAGVGIVAALLGSLLTQGFARSREERREEKALRNLVDGIGKEYRLNLFEALGEMQALVIGRDGDLLSDIDRATHLDPGRLSLVPVEPILHRSAMTNLADLDHATMAIIGYGYRELERQKQGIREAVEERRLVYGQVQDLVHEVVKGLASLYLWNNYYGRTPADVGSVRKRDLLAFARRQGLDRFSFPGMHLFDLLTQYLRGFGLKVTPVPLTMTAAEYYSKPGGAIDRHQRMDERKRRREELEARLQAGENVGLIDRLRFGLPLRDKRTAEHPEPAEPMRQHG